MNDQLVIYSTKASEYFAENIATNFGLTSCGGIERKMFGDKEKYLRITGSRGNLFGKTVIIVGSTHTDPDFEDLTDIAEACQDARQKIFVIPFFGYSTMERAVLPNEVVKAKKRACQLSNILHGDFRNAFFMFDLHVSGLVHYFEGNCLRHEIYGGDVFVKALEKIFWEDYYDEGFSLECEGDIKKVLAEFDVKFVSADLGRPAWVKYYAKQFGTGSIAVVDKDREGEKTKVENVIGDVEGKDCIIYDDMSRTFKTLINATIAYLAKGARSVSAVLSHFAVCDDGVVQEIEDSPLKWVLVSNSHPASQLDSVKNSKKIIVVDASHLFVENIKKLLT